MCLLDAAPTREIILIFIIKVYMATLQESEAKQSVLAEANWLRLQLIQL